MFEFLYPYVGNPKALLSSVNLPAALLRELSRPNLVNRLGCSFAERDAGPYVWFHVPDLSQCAASLPVIFRSLQEYNEKVGILVTVATQDAFAVARKALPKRVIVLLMPLDNPFTAAMFMRKWRPQVGVFMESPFDTSLILIAAQYDVRLSLINAHIGPNDMLSWHNWHSRYDLCSYRKLLCNTLRCFTLIVPQSDMDVGHLRLFGTTMQQMPGWSSDLMQVAALGSSLWGSSLPSKAISDLKNDLQGRHVWLAANVDASEEVLIAGVHHQLQQHGSIQQLLTVLSPRDPSRCNELSVHLRRAGLSVELWSDKPLSFASDVLILDDPSQLDLFYHACEVVYLGGSMVTRDGEAATSVSEVAAAAVAGCALVLGGAAAEGQMSGLVKSLNAAAIHSSEEAAAAVMSSGHSMEDIGPVLTPEPPARRASGGSEGVEFNGPENRSSPDRNGSGSQGRSISYLLSQAYEQCFTARRPVRPSTAPAQEALGFSTPAPSGLAMSQTRFARGASCGAVPNSAGTPLAFFGSGADAYAYHSRVASCGPLYAQAPGYFSGGSPLGGGSSADTATYWEQRQQSLGSLGSPSWRKAELSELLTPGAQIYEEGHPSLLTPPPTSSWGSCIKSDACTQTDVPGGGLVGGSSQEADDWLVDAVLSPAGSKDHSASSELGDLFDSHAVITLQLKRESFASWMESEGGSSPLASSQRRAMKNSKRFSSDCAPSRLALSPDSSPCQFVAGLHHMPSPTMSSSLQVYLPTRLSADSPRHFAAMADVPASDDADAPAVQAPPAEGELEALFDLPSFPAKSSDTSANHFAVGLGPVHGDRAQSLCTQGENLRPWDAPDSHALSDGKLGASMEVPSSGLAPAPVYSDYPVRRPSGEARTVVSAVSSMSMNDTSAFIGSKHGSNNRADAPFQTVETPWPNACQTMASTCMECDTSSAHSSSVDIPVSDTKRATSCVPVDEPIIGSLQCMVTPGQDLASTVYQPHGPPCVRIPSITLSPRKPSASNVELGYGPTAMDSPLPGKPSWMPLNANGDLCSDGSTSSGSPVSPISGNTIQMEPTSPRVGSRGNTCSPPRLSTRMSDTLPPPHDSDGLFKMSLDVWSPRTGNLQGGCPEDRSRMMDALLTSGRNSPPDQDQADDPFAAALSCSASYYGGVKEIAQRLMLDFAPIDSSQPSSGDKLCNCESMDDWLTGTASQGSSAGGPGDRSLKPPLQKSRAGAPHTAAVLPKATSSLVLGDPRYVASSHGEGADSSVRLESPVTESPRRLSLDSPTSRNNSRCLISGTGTLLQEALPLPSRLSTTSPHRRLSMPLEDLFAAPCVGQGGLSEFVSGLEVGFPQAPVVSRHGLFGEGPDEDEVPETPTSRISSNSFFAQDAVYDQPYPWKSSVSSVVSRDDGSPLACLTALPPPKGTAISTPVTDQTNQWKVDQWQQKNSQHVLLDPSSSWQSSPSSTLSTESEAVPHASGTNKLRQQSANKPPLHSPRGRPSSSTEPPPSSNASMDQLSLLLLLQTERLQAPLSPGLRVRAPRPSPCGTPSQRSPAHQSNSSSFSTPRSLSTSRSLSIPRSDLHTQVLKQQTLKAAYCVVTSGQQPCCSPGFSEQTLPSSSMQQELPTNPMLQADSSLSALLGSSLTAISAPRGRASCVDGRLSAQGSPRSQQHRSKSSPPDSPRRAQSPSACSQVLPLSPRNCNPTGFCTQLQSPSRNSRSVAAISQAMMGSPERSKSEPAVPPSSPRKCDTPRSSAEAVRLRQMSATSPPGSPFLRLFNDPFERKESDVASCLPEPQSPRRLSADPRTLDRTSVFEETSATQQCRRSVYEHDWCADAEPPPSPRRLSCAGEEMRKKVRNQIFLGGQRSQSERGRPATVEPESPRRLSCAGEVMKDKVRNQIFLGGQRSQSERGRPATVEPPPESPRRLSCAGEVMKDKVRDQRFLGGQRSMSERIRPAAVGPPPPSPRRLSCADEVMKNKVRDQRFLGGQRSMSERIRPAAVGPPPPSPRRLSCSGEVVKKEVRDQMFHEGATFTPAAADKRNGQHCEQAAASNVPQSPRRLSLVRRKSLSCLSPFSPTPAMQGPHLSCRHSLPPLIQEPQSPRRLSIEQLGRHSREQMLLGSPPGTGVPPDAHPPASCLSPQEEPERSPPRKSVNLSPPVSNGLGHNSLSPLGRSSVIHQAPHKRVDFDGQGLASWDEEDREEAARKARRGQVTRSEEPSNQLAVLLQQGLVLAAATSEIPQSHDGASSHAPAAPLSARQLMGSPDRRPSQPNSARQSVLVPPPSPRKCDTPQSACSVRMRQMNSTSPARTAYRKLFTGKDKEAHFSTSRSLFADAESFPINLGQAKLLEEELNLNTMQGDMSDRRTPVPIGSNMGAVDPLTLLRVESLMDMSTCQPPQSLPHVPPPKGVVALTKPKSVLPLSESPIPEFPRASEKTLLSPSPQRLLITNAHASGSGAQQHDEPGCSLAAASLAASLTADVTNSAALATSHGHLQSIDLAATKQMLRSWHMERLPTGPKKSGLEGLEDLIAPLKKLNMVHGSRVARTNRLLPATATAASAATVRPLSPCMVVPVTASAALMIKATDAMTTNQLYMQQQQPANAPTVPSKAGFTATQSTVEAPGPMPFAQAPADMEAWFASVVASNLLNTGNVLCLPLPTALVKGQASSPLPQQTAAVPVVCSSSTQQQCTAANEPGQHLLERPRMADAPHYTHHGTTPPHLKHPSSRWGSADGEDLAAGGLCGTIPPHYKHASSRWGSADDGDQAAGGFPSSGFIYEELQSIGKELLSVDAQISSAVSAADSFLYALGGAAGTLGPQATTSTWAQPPPPHAAPLSNLPTHTSPSPGSRAPLPTDVTLSSLHQEMHQMRLEHHQELQELKQMVKALLSRPPAICYVMPGGSLPDEVTTLLPGTQPPQAAPCAPPVPASSAGRTASSVGGAALSERLQASKLTMGAAAPSLAPDAFARSSAAAARSSADHSGGGCAADTLLPVCRVETILPDAASIGGPSNGQRRSQADLHVARSTCHPARSSDTHDQIRTRNMSSSATCRDVSPPAFVGAAHRTNSLGGSANPLGNTSYSISATSLDQAPKNTAGASSRGEGHLMDTRDSMVSLAYMLSAGPMNGDWTHDADSSLPVSKTNSEEQGRPRGPGLANYPFPVLGVRGKVGLKESWHCLSGHPELSESESQDTTGAGCTSPSASTSDSACGGEALWGGNRSADERNPDAAASNAEPCRSGSEHVARAAADGGGSRDDPPTTALWGKRGSSGMVASVAKSVPVGSMACPRADDARQHNSHTRYHGECIIPASHLPRGSIGPAVWCVPSEDDLTLALSKLLRDPVERRSRGHAAAQGAAKLASGLVSNVWNVLDGNIITPALHEFIKRQGGQ